MKVLASKESIKDMEATFLKVDNMSRNELKMMVKLYLSKLSYLQHIIQPERNIEFVNKDDQI